MLSLPTRLGGLGIIDLSKIAASEFATSTKLSAPLMALIVAQECCYSVDLDEQRKVKAEARASKCSSQLQKLKGLTGSFTPTLRRAVELSGEKGASTWLTVPEHGFSLHKGAFRDALCLRYA